MSKDRQFIVVEARTDVLRLHFVRRAGDAVEWVESRSIAPQDTESDASSLTDQILLDAAAKSIRNRGDWSAADVVCLVGGGDAACHFFDLPPLAGAALKDAVRLKLDEQLHFPVDEAVIDITRSASDAPGEGGAAPVRVAALRRETADAAIAFSMQIHRPLAALTAAPAALAELALRTKQIAGEPRAVLSINPSCSTLLVSNGGKPLLTTELPVGLNTFSAALMRPIIAGEDVLQLTKEQAAALRDTVGVPAPDLEIDEYGIKGKNLLPLLEPALQRFVQQLTQWLTYVGTHENGAKVQRLSVVGAGAAMPGLTGALGRRLRIEATNADWLKGLVRTTAQAGGPGDADAAIAAVRFLDAMPNLLPESERKRRRIARIRNSTTKAGPVIAAATLGIAFLFNQIGGRLSRAVGDVQHEMSRMQHVIDRNAELQQQHSAVARMRGEFDSFAGATPHWLGMFKELSLILPRELQVTRLSTQHDEAGIRLNVEGEVVASAPGQSTDEVVEEALTALERSPFASAVHLVNLSRGKTASGADGTVAVELTLAYRRPERVQPN